MTKDLFVLGHPVAHSKSPVMHNAAYQALGLPWVYGFADCATSEEAKEFLESGQWLAINITMPYKPLALSMADYATASAQAALGANVLAHTADGLKADNTDGRGCISYLQRCGVKFGEASVVVCGTGPTSLALMESASAAGAACVTLAGRDDDKTHVALEGYLKRIANETDSVTGKSAKTIFAAGSYRSLNRKIADANIVLDATPLGMHAGDGAPFDTELLNAKQVVFDVVYGHGETELLKAARAKGCQTYDGQGMLVAQAVETVYDLVEWLQVPVDLQAVDLFPIMAKAAEFDL